MTGATTRMKRITTITIIIPPFLCFPRSARPQRFRCAPYGPVSNINRCPIALGNASQQDQREDDNYDPLHNSSFLSKPAPFSAELPGPTVSAVGSVKVADAEVLKLCTKFGRSRHDDHLHFRTRCGVGKGANKIELFWPGCCGGLGRWPGEVKEAEGELKFMLRSSAYSAFACR
jgi:hypothetical protein